MKNRILALVLVSVMVLSMTACGKKASDETADAKPQTEETQKQPEIEYNVDDYVTLGDYKGIEVTLDGEYEYTKEGFEKYIQSTLEGAALFVEDKSQKEVKEDSIVNVDYVGSQDGVAFDGGSAENQMIDVANNCSAGSYSGYIEGFTSGLAGHKVGEEVAYEVTFPEKYGNADLAGQTVIFTFQINYVAKAIQSKSDLTDEIVSENFGVATVDEYIDSLKEKYTTELETSKKNDTETAVLNTLINNCKVENIPDELVQARVDLFLSMQERQYQAYGTTMKDYMASMGMDYDEEVAKIKERLQESTETELILEAIAKAEGMEVDEEGYKEFIERVYTNMGYTDEQSFYKDFSVDGYSGERYFKLAYLTEKATDFVVENAVVK